MQKLLSLRTATGSSPDNPEFSEKTRMGLTLLHSPEDPLIDFIFVHGLGGGSIKTWRKVENQSYFWPKAWLPLEDGLRNVRTSSFGYQSDWAARRDSILNIHDFGRRLLGDLLTSPYLRRDKGNAIVLIGHSMGGLVIKKAYLLARQESRDIAQRIKCMFFFGTPHRGSDSADLLKNILRLSMLERPYVDDLMKHSLSLQLINDEFRNVADELRLWSFYETLKTNLVFKSEIIVEKDSAILGYKHEEIQPLDADHRGICKFDSKEDSNYITVKNAMVVVVDELLASIIQEQGDERSLQMQAIGSYLDIGEAPESDLEDQQSLKVAGSCTWIEDRENFRRWMNIESFAEKSVAPYDVPSHGQAQSATLLVGNCSMYWLKGKPGAGKSVLAAHVVSLLRENGNDCSYFFFKFGVRNRQVLSALFRSLAYQMALYHSSVRKLLFNMNSAGNSFDKDDQGTIWRKLFSNGVFKVPVDRPQYWVVDALDECLAVEKLFAFLSKVECGFHLRILFTSRPTPELERCFSRLKAHLVADQIEAADTQADMTLYLASSFPLDDPEFRRRMMNKMLAKSDDCFLWLRIVHQELEHLYSEESIAGVLEEIPEQMSDLYQRSIDALGKDTREKKLIQALLIWTACSARPLTLAELQTALKIDAGLQVRDLRRSIEGLCGNLLKVDQEDRVQPIHFTVRSFLLDKELDSEFAVHRELGHERLAITCLKYMDEEMPPLRSRSIAHVRLSRKQEYSDFVKYASTAFSEHLAGSSTSSDALLMALSNFLANNVLVWIEYIASEESSLYVLTRTAKNLKRYLRRRSKHVSPLGEPFRMVDDWSTDLIRLVARFGRNLKDYPSSILYLIPSIAPRESMLHKQSFKGPHRLELIGDAASSWDDCVSIIDYKDTWATALACGQNAFAIGMKNGTIVLYDQSTCQEMFTVEHESAEAPLQLGSTVSTRRPTPIRLLVFDSSDTKLASASLQTICVWSSSGDLLNVLRLQEQCVSLAFALGTEEMIGISRSSRIVRWSLIEDEPSVSILSMDTKRLSVGYMNKPNLAIPRQAPLAAAISPDQTVLALLYRAKPIYLWSLEDNTLLGVCGRDAASDRADISVQTALFNPNAESGLLAVAHQDGELTIYDAWRQEPLRRVDGDAYSLASTPDGRTLASGNTRGIIQLWDFETLTLLYCIKSGIDEVRSLAFSGDGRRLVDIRGTRTKVWEPEALIRRNMEEDASVSDSTVSQAQIVGENTEIIAITVMAADQTGQYVFAGRDDGSVVVFDTESGRLQRQLYSHDGELFITAIDVHDSSRLTSADAGGRVLLWNLSVVGKFALDGKPLLDVNITEPVQQLLISPNGSRLLVVTSNADAYWDLDHRKKIQDYGRTTSDLSSHRRWMAFTQQHVALLIHDVKLELHLHSWDSLQKRQIIDFNMTPPFGTISTTFARQMTVDQSQKHIVASFTPRSAGKLRTQMMVWNNPVLMPGTEKEFIESDAPLLVIPAQEMRLFLGTCFDQAIFLDHELWVCSIDLNRVKTTGSEERKRHFFIPPDFMTGSSAPDPILTTQGHIIFGKESKLAIIKGGLDWSL